MLPLRLLIVSLVLTWALPAHAWIFHEHWLVGKAGVEGQNAERSEVFEEAWRRVIGEGTQFCAGTTETGENLKRGGACVDFAALSALAGDHSCNPTQMWEYARDQTWVTEVLKVAAQTAVNMAGAKTLEERNDFWDLSHLAFEGADREYSTRAGENNAHFLLGRETRKLPNFLARSVAREAPANAMGLYSLYHLAAVRLAYEAHRVGQSDPKKQRELWRRALSAEAYGQHFLEDMFSAGHIAGIWGDVADRKGTHDYYSINGIDAQLWDGRGYVARGDAHAHEVDYEFSGAAVAASLAQVIDAGTGRSPIVKAIAGISLEAAAAYESMDSCKMGDMDRPLPDKAALSLLDPVLQATIMPARSEGAGSLPRFRAEIGPFLRMCGAARTGAAFSGFATNETRDGHNLARTARLRGSLAVGLGVGVGLEGITGRSGDGSVFLNFAFVADSPQFDGPCPSCTQEFKDKWHRGYGSPLPRVPGREGLQGRLRAPFYLIPGDLLVVGPLLALVAPDAAKAMALRAVRGGLIPWQRTMLTRIGSFQFIAGREVALTFYGYHSNTDAFIYESDEDDGYGALLHPVELKTIELHLPFFEYRPYRQFQSKITNAVLLQLGFSVDFATGSKFIELAPNDTIQDDLGASLPMKNSYMVYAKIAFDGRIYL